MSMLEIKKLKYNDGRTKQAFKDSTDINKILKKAQISGGLSHALKYPEAIYGEFTGVDLLGAYEQIGRANAIFDDLPSEVRNEFKNDALAFAGYASDPVNIKRLAELLPAIAKPGSYFPNVSGRPESPPAAVSPAVVPPGPPDPQVPPAAASEGGVS